MDFFQMLTATSSIKKKPKPKQPTTAPPAHPSFSKSKKKKKRNKSDNQSRPRSLSDASFDGEGVKLTTNLSPIRNSKPSSSTSSNPSTPSSASLELRLHQEAITSFRRRLKLHIGETQNCPDPMQTFEQLRLPGSSELLRNYKVQILGNIEKGRWKEPTPIQMQVSVATRTLQ